MVNVRLRDPEVSYTHWGRPSGDSFTNFVISVDCWTYKSYMLSVAGPGQVFGGGQSHHRGGPPEI